MKISKNDDGYRWVIVILCGIMVLAVLGFCSSPKSLLISPICSALGISRGAFSINESVRYITTSVINIFFGVLISKFGYKKLILSGFACLILSTFIYMKSTNVYGFYIGSVFLGAGLSWTTTTMVGAVINKWCPDNQGTIMGAILASNGIGAAVSTQILTPIIYQSGNPFGYRASYRLIIAILIVVACLIAVLFKDKTPSSDKKTNKDSENTDIFKKSYFYISAVCIFFTGMILQSVTGIAAPMLGDVGIDPSFVATVLSVHYVALTLSKFNTGFLTDRIGTKKTSVICFVAGVFAMILLLCSSDSASGRISAMGYGILSTVALPLETIMLPVYAKAISKDNSFNKILGIFVSVNTAGYATGAPVANYCYDILGSYNVYIYICIVLIILSATGMQTALNQAEK